MGGNRRNLGGGTTSLFEMKRGRGPTGDSKRSTLRVLYRKNQVKKGEGCVQVRCGRTSQET